MGKPPLCGQSAGRMIDAMAGRAVRVVLELEPDEESITGRLQLGNGSTRDFAGWLGLINALQGLMPAATGPNPLDAEQP
jgi:hypothetical protein